MQLPSKQVTFIIFIPHFGTELQLQASQNPTERDPCTGICFSPADSKNLTHMPHKPLDCLSRASPPGPTIYCYLQCERTRSALPAARRTFSASRCTKGRWLRSPARGALGTGGGSQPGTTGGHGQGLGQLNGPRQAPLTQRPRLQGGPFPLQPPRRAPGTPDRRAAEPAGPARPAQRH